MEGALTRGCIVVMGVTGAGKSTFGVALAQDRGWMFVDGDTLHAPQNIDRMRRGVPLTDADRDAWLASIGQVLADAAGYPAGVVVACSALKKTYRDRFRRIAPNVRFILLQVDRPTVVRRLAARSGHFMSADLIDSQFATLEVPAHGETDVLVLEAVRSLGELLAASMDVSV